jgi:hypothetical protein
MRHHLGVVGMRAQEPKSLPGRRQNLTWFSPAPAGAPRSSGPRAGQARAATGVIWSVVQAGNRLTGTGRPWELARRAERGDHAASSWLDEVLGKLAAVG